MHGIIRKLGILTIAGMAIAGSAVALAQDTPEIEVGLDFVGPVKLKDGQFFALTRGQAAMYSSDGGRTWPDTATPVDQEGRPLRGRPFSLIRLQSGALAVTYWRRRSAQEPGLGAESMYFTKSMDEGTTWSTPVRVNWPGSPAYAQWLIQTKTGRLVLANEYWYEHKGSDTGLGICTAYYSDDEGKTWAESADSIILRKGRALFDSLQVPCISETADGRLLMFMRNEVGRIAQSYSEDGGQHWTAASLNDLVSSNSEIWLSQIPGTGDLLCVWNQASTQEVKTGYYRARLTSAISKDSGATWEHFRTLAMSPGQKRITRIANPSPPAHLSSPGAVPPKELTAPEGFHMNTFPRVKFIGDKAYLVYNHRVYKYPEGSTRWKREYNSRRLRVIPIAWFYGDQDPHARNPTLKKLNETARP